METKIRLLFAAVILWQPLQYFISAHYGEPYPALIMPGFAGTMSDGSGNIRFVNVKCKVLFRDGQVRWVSAYDLLSQAPSSHHRPILDHMFRPVAQQLAVWPKDGLKAKLFPGRAKSRAQAVEMTLDSETKQWLRGRVQSIYPGQEIQSISFVWNENVFNEETGALSEAQEPIGVREVQFD